MSAMAPEKRRKAYIAGPMRGLPSFNFPAFFAAEVTLTERGWECFNPARNDCEMYGLDCDRPGPAGQWLIDNPQDFDLRGALAADMKFIAEEAEAIVLLPGWDGSKGALAERALSDALGHEVLYWHPDTGQALPTPYGPPVDTYDVVDGNGTVVASFEETRMTVSDLFTGLEAEARALARGEQRERESWLADRLIGTPPSEEWVDEMRPETESGIPGAKARYIGPANGETRMTSATGGQKGTKLAAFDQISPAILWELAEHFGRGALKYDAHNFRKGYPWSQSFSALCRHLWEFWGGKEWDVCPSDREGCKGPILDVTEHGPTCYNHTGSRVIVAVIWHAMALAEFSRYPQFKEYDDRYVYQDD